MLHKWLRIAAKKLLDNMDAAGILASVLCLVGLTFGWKAYVAWRQGIGWHGTVAWYGKGNGSLQQWELSSLTLFAGAWLLAGIVLVVTARWYHRPS